KQLLDQLVGASDAPRDKDGVKRHALPQFFNTWSRSAWVDVLGGLPEEDAAGAVDDSAAEEFRRLVSQAMLAQVTLGELVQGEGHEDVVQTQRRSLVGWGWRFAPSGRWQSVRSYRCWCRLDEYAGGEIRLRVAIRHELFSQLGTDRRLVEMGAKTFARQAARYGVGRAEEDERPQ